MATFSITMSESLEMKGGVHGQLFTLGTNLGKFDGERDFNPICLWSERKQTCAPPIKTLGRSWLLTSPNSLHVPNSLSFQNSARVVKSLDSGKSLFASPGASCERAARTLAGAQRCARRCRTRVAHRLHEASLLRDSGCIDSGRLSLAPTRIHRWIRPMTERHHETAPQSGRITSFRGAAGYKPSERKGRNLRSKYRSVVI